VVRQVHKSRSVDGAPGGLLNLNGEPQASLGSPFIKIEYQDNILLL